MKHTPKIKKAIQFAARRHHGKFRKETELLPYITHPFSVALLVAESGGGEDAVIAALLHDTIEDTETTAEEIALQFGESIAVLVGALSEELSKETSWRMRKEAYLRALGEASDDAV